MRDTKNIQDREIFDSKTAMDRIGNNKKLFDEYVSIVIQDIPISLDKLNKALSGHDFKTITAQAHSVKTMAATIGANLLRNVALEVENSGRSGNIEAIHKLAINLNDEFERFRHFVSKK